MASVFCCLTWYHLSDIINIKLEDQTFLSTLSNTRLFSHYFFSEATNRTHFFCLLDRNKILLRTKIKFLWSNFSCQQNVQRILMRNKAVFCFCLFLQSNWCSSKHNRLWVTKKKKHQDFYIFTEMMEVFSSFSNDENIKKYDLFS